MHDCSHFLSDKARRNIPLIFIASLSARSYIRINSHSHLLQPRQRYGNRASSLGIEGLQGLYDQRGDAVGSSSFRILRNRVFQGAGSGHTRVKAERPVLSYGPTGASSSYTLAMVRDGACDHIQPDADADADCCGADGPHSIFSLSCVAYQEARFGSLPSPIDGNR